MSWSGASPGAIYGPRKPSADQHGHDGLRAGREADPRRDNFEVPDVLLPPHTAVGRGDEVR